MLLINKTILDEISAAFLGCDTERGFLLGSDNHVTHISHCFDLPAADAGLHYFTPDPAAADEAILRWGNQGVCFCGIVHSHVVNKAELSENDIAYAKVLFDAYQLPVLWFGIGIVSTGDVLFRFYAVTKSDGQIRITFDEHKIME